MELIDPLKREPGFTIPAGLRIQGGWGRHEYIPKHAFRLFFKTLYGPGQLEYPLFPESPVQEFDTLILRSGANRSYAGSPWMDHRLDTYARDEWMRMSQQAMSGAAARGRFVHLYINGLYWGLYNIVERPDASFASAHLGGEREDWFAINHGGPISGDISRFAALQETLEEIDTLSPSEIYPTIAEFVDIAQFIDYLILHWYASHNNWSDNNWYAGLRNPQGKLMFFAWDGEEIWREMGPRFELTQEHEDPERLLVITHLFNALPRQPSIQTPVGRPYLRQPF